MMLRSRHHAATRHAQFRTVRARASGHPAASIQEVQHITEQELGPRLRGDERERAKDRGDDRCLFERLGGLTIQLEEDLAGGRSPFVPAKAGIQGRYSALRRVWVPACARTNGRELKQYRR